MRVVVVLARPLVLVVVLAIGCGQEFPASRGRTVVGADPVRGAAAVRARACGACHQIPTIPAARGRVGPSLDGFADRVLIAGAVPNTAGDLVRWLRDPSAIQPRTAMPALGLSESEAQDIAAFLYTLGDRQLWRSWLPVIR
jgi:cytochrome c1